MGAGAVEAAARGDGEVTSEKRVLAEQLIALTELPETCAWRHNSGQAWQGKRQDFYPGTSIPVPPGVVVLKDARPVKFGLEGSGDIIGAIQRRPLAVESKTLTGRQRDTQILFERAWVKAGGIYILARSADEMLAKIHSALDSNPLANLLG